MDKQPVTVASYSKTSTRRAALIVRDDNKPKDMRFEVVYELPRPRFTLGWAFFATRKAADVFVSEIR